ncbi:MAG: YDG domain-containing protein [Candidatus Peribacteria bacterium]|nr:YDG domain-containing protein [Candidatus Peribacteria bacterium]
MATATYDTATVGTNKTITVVYTLIGADASKYLPPVNYVVNNGEIISKPSGGANYS